MTRCNLVEGESGYCTIDDDGALSGAPAVHWERVGDHGWPVPIQGTEGEPGFGLMAAHAFSLWPEEHAAIAIGWRIAIPVGYVGIIADWRGLAFKRLTTRSGIMGPYHRRDIKVVVVNENHSRQLEFEGGEYIAQLVVVPSPTLVSAEVSLLPPGPHDAAVGGGVTA